MSRARARRRRLALTLTAAVVAGVWAGPVADALAGPSAVPVARTSYTVRAGDTLWAIATRIAPGQDPRAIVAAIADVNGLRTGQIVPGQSLVVPAAG